jgi:hypothetical protein
VPTGSDSITATVRADVDEGPSDGSDSVDLEGEEFIVVAQDGSGDITSIRNAIDSVSGSTIIVESGTYDTETELGSYGNNVNGVNADGTFVFHNVFQITRDEHSSR